MDIKRAPAGISRWWFSCQPVNLPGVHTRQSGVLTGACIASKSLAHGSSVGAAADRANANANAALRKTNFVFKDLASSNGCKECDFLRKISLSFEWTLYWSAGSIISSVLQKDMPQMLCMGVGLSARGRSCFNIITQDLTTVR